MIQKVGMDDDKLDGGDNGLSLWSEDAVELAQIVKQLGIVPEVCVEEYILEFFKQLTVQKKQIT